MPLTSNQSKSSIYNYISGNKRQTWVVMVVFILLVGVLGYIFSIALEQGVGFFLGAVGLASGMSFFSFYFSDRVILAISGAKPIQKRDNPRLFRTVENLCLGAGLPYPEIYIISDTAPNAFATGRDPKHAKVAVTTGLLSKLTDAELEGVIAHELSHIKNFDIRLMSIVVILVGIIALLSDFFRRGGLRVRGSRRSREGGSGVIILIALIASLLAPLIAQLLKLALSRQREYLADSSAALLTRYPEGLASALIKISNDYEPLEVANAATAHLYIVNPLKNYSDRVAGLFSTHPPVEERVRRLRKM